VEHPPGNVEEETLSCTSKPEALVLLNQTLALKFAAQKLSPRSQLQSFTPAGEEPS